MSKVVIPAKAGIQDIDRYISQWIPAFAGMTALSRSIRKRLVSHVA